MAAITAVLSLFKSGDKIIIPDNLYGGTFRVIDKVFKNFNINYELVDISHLSSIKKIFDKYRNSHNIKAVFVETPTNPLMDITDIENVSSFAS